MRAWIAASLLCIANVAHGEVFLDDSTIELSAEYTYQPVTFANQTEASTGTGIHVEDRNGVFARFVVKMLRGATDRSVDDPYQWHETKKTTTYLGGGVFETTTFYISLGAEYVRGDQRTLVGGVEQGRNDYLFRGRYEMMSLVLAIGGAPRPQDVRFDAF